jgi:hypothetical protein
LGIGISSSLIPQESYALKLTTDYGKSNYEADLASEFNEKFEDMKATLELAASSSSTSSRNYKSVLEVSTFRNIMQSSK